MQRVKRMCRAPRDAAEQHCFEYVGSKYQDFELEEGARSVEIFEGVHREAAPCVVYAPVEFDGHIGVVVDGTPGIGTRSFGCTSRQLPLHCIWWWLPASASCIKI